ncbi:MULTISPECIES: hypothetical protein [unclassified Oceanobacillus]|uniref:hypothetical protein n=1 Tax=unclassified Oceanobacillus TaxID=2630292 RepID=UPI001BE79AD8|nr:MULTISPECIES: hypothetical protein [unclassified Oceanobacillus]MBT2599102.1 hypothetical protein [Oceanobacillus sp. ISL-74]MBT2652020.1 hypothetical protein [Oceanobacillus sp. ISL-73]
MDLTEKQLKLITDVASQNAIKAFKEDQIKQQNEKHDTRLRNIKLLLKNYRALVLHCERLEDDFVKFENTSIQALDLEEISFESIESIKQSKTKSLAMVYFVRGKMEAYKRSCNEDEFRYFRVLEKKYLTPRKYTIQEIAEREGIDRATVYRYLDKAIEELPVIFFGVTAIKFE